MPERSTKLTDRSKQFAISIIRFYGALPKAGAGRVIGMQVLRSATSVGAHVREARRSRSIAEMISKTKCALQEIDETSYWLELLQESNLASIEQLTDLRREADELTAMLVSSARTMTARKTKRRV